MKLGPWAGPGRGFQGGHGIISAHTGVREEGGTNMSLADFRTPVPNGH